MRPAQPIISDILLHNLAAGAQEHDLGGPDLAQEIGWLAEEGWIVGALPMAVTRKASWSDDPACVFNVLESLGFASLPVGRLFEGHVNAAQLVGLYGSERLKAEYHARARRDELFGIWGANGDPPVMLKRSTDGYRLTGVKRFCSGLGLIRLALISAQYEGKTRLVAVEVSEPTRADLQDWKMSGMRATVSGAFNFDGLGVNADAIIGEPDQYYAEPYFLGGMYRMCAVQVGGLRALLEAFLARAHGLTTNELMKYRCGEIATLLYLANTATQHLVRLLQSETEAPKIAEAAILMREGVEHCIVQALAIVQRATGTMAHREANDVSRISRDLSLYIRQAAIDARLILVGEQLLNKCSA